MNDHPTGSAPNFTTACVVLFGVNVTWVFLFVWVVWGLIAVAALGWVLNRWMLWIAARRAAEDARFSLPR